MAFDRSRVSLTSRRSVQAVLSCLVLASCSATSDMDSAMFGFSPQYGPAGVPGEEAETPNAVALAALEATETQAATPPLANEAGAEEQAVAAAAGDAQDQAAPQEDAVAAAAPAAPAEAEASAEAEDKRGFLSAFFSQEPARDVPTPIIDRGNTDQAGDEADAAETKPLIDLKEAKEEAEPARVVTASLEPMDALPGVRDNAGLFEISSASGLTDEGNLDLYETGGSYEVASAAGFARLAPNGLLKQREDVDVSCLKPALVRMLRTIERRFGERVIVTSGYRSKEHNRRVRGARNSYHMYCSAADVQVPGVDKWTLAKFARSLPGRGGVGTYCHTTSVHVDVGPERDWNWRCK